MEKEIIRNSELELTIDMKEGMNVNSMRYRGVETVLCDEGRKREGRTYAIPLLFPTPNRTRDGFYTFCGMRVPAVMHGWARKSEFKVIERGDSFITGEATFKDTPSCPYDIALRLRIALEDKGAIWSLTITNNGEAQFPYGIALHPFFDKSKFESVVSNLESRMVTDDSLLPLGSCVRDDRFSSPCDLSQLEVDAVFIRNGRIRSTLIAPTFSLEIFGDEAFDHVVIFTEADKPFICVEPQTCSTDFINMTNRGFIKEAHMLVLPPKQTVNHEISMVFSDR